MEKNMSQHNHIESHNRFSYVIRDAVIGLSDGLTVPFALAAGLSGAVDTTTLIVTAGIAEIAAGAIAMGLGGYMAARTEADQFMIERKREMYEINNVPHIEQKEVTDLLEEYGVDHQDAMKVAVGLQKNPEKWVDFMMRFELGLEKPDPKELIHTPLTIGISYILGGMVPLFPYMIYDKASDALPASIITTLLALGIFGTLKGHYTGIGRTRSAVQTLVIGGLAAAVAFYLARLLS
jgi:VIT1/CCC1 family predicted Fe2+/Mn2+ transporter